MIYILEMTDTFSDTWQITFYFVLALVILIATLWTFYQMHKNDKFNKKLDENIIYNKPIDLIENMEDTIPKRKKKNVIENENYYDVYQTEIKKNMLNNNKEEKTYLHDNLIDIDNGINNTDISLINQISKDENNINEITNKNNRVVNKNQNNNKNNAINSNKTTNKKGKNNKTHYNKQNNGHKYNNKKSKGR